MSIASDYSDIFVSYRRKDVEFVKELVEHLQKTGKEVWVDWEDIPPGSVSFSEDIKRGLDGADMFLCVLTPDYLESTYCVDLELGYAVRQNKKIIPIVLKKFEGHPIPDGIGHINWIYFTPHAGQSNTFEEAFPRIISAMETDLDYIRNHKNFLLRAIEWDQKERRTSFLLDGDEIIAAEDWLVEASGKTPLPTELQKEYITVSRHTEDKRRRRVTTWIYLALVVTMVLTILSAYFGFDAVRQRNIANTAREQAEQLAAQVQALLLSNNAKNANQEGDPVLALALIQRAIEYLEQPTSQVQQEYASLVYEPGPVTALELESGEVTELLVSPREDIMATAVCDDDSCNNPSLYIWDLETRAIIDTITVPNLSGRITALAFDKSREGRSEQLAIAMCATPDDTDNCDSGTVIAILNLDNDTIWNLWNGHDLAIEAMAFSRDGARLVTGSRDSSVAVWDLQNQSVITTISSHVDSVWGVGFTEDGTRVLSTGCTENCEDGNIILSDAWTGEIIELYEDSAGKDPSMLILPDGNSAIIEGGNGTLFIWDIERGRQRFTINGHRGNIESIWVNADGGAFVTTASDRSIAVWQNIPDREPALQAQFYYDGDDILGGGLLNSGQQVISGLSDNPDIMIWDITNGAIENTFRNMLGIVNWVAYSPDDLHVAGVTENNTIIISTIDAESPLKEWETSAAYISGIEYTPDGQSIATAGCEEVANDECEEAYIRLRNAETGVIWKSFAGHENVISDFSFSPDGAYLISFDESSGNDMNTVLIWSVAGDDESWIHKLEVPDVRDVGWSIDSSRFFLVTAESISIRNLTDATEVLQIKSDTHFQQAIALPHTTNQSSDNVEMLATVDSDEHMSIWDLATGQLLNRTLISNTSVPAGSMVAAGSMIFVEISDKIVVFDQAGNKLREYSNERRVSEIATNSDGSRVLAGGDSGFTLWRVDTFEELLSWAQNNRYIVPLTCNEEANYNLSLSSACEGG